MHQRVNGEPAMKHPIAKTTAATAIMLGLLVGSAAAIPQLRHAAAGWWNRPDRLAALPDVSQVHYEEGAIERARVVAELLPAALARVEAVHGRPFAQPVIIG